MVQQCTPNNTPQYNKSVVDIETVVQVGEYQKPDTKTRESRLKDLQIAHLCEEKMA
jgi:hypothetical protein